MTSIIFTLLIFLYRIPLINILGDKGMGYYSIALALYMLLMTCISYGIPKALSSLIAEQSSKGQFALVNKTIISAFIFAFLTGIITAILLFFGANIIASHIMCTPQSTMAIQGIAPCLLFIPVLGVLHGVYAGIRVPSLSKMTHLLEELLVPLLSIVGAIIARNNTSLLDEPVYTSFGASVGFSAGVFIVCIFASVIFIKYRKKLNRLAKKNSVTVKETNRELILILIRRMLPFILTLIIFHLSCVMDYAIFNRIMSVQGHKENSYIILLGMLNGKYEFFISIPFFFVNWYAASKVSVLIKNVQEANTRKIHNSISQSLRNTMLYILPITVFYIFYAKPLMNLLFTGNNDTPAMLLRTGAISIIFYSVSAISNATLNSLEEWRKVVKNAFISLIVQLMSLLIMMIIFQWTIVAVVISRIVFSASLFILNEHQLRERTGYVQEQKRTFTLPAISSLIMGGVSFVVYFVFDLFIHDKMAVIIAFVVAVPTYILALVFTGGITQREMYRLPGGKLLAPLCRKLHLIK